jgi:hypothetical protein
VSLSITLSSSMICPSPLHLTATPSWLALVQVDGHKTLVHDSQSSQMDGQNKRVSQCLEMFLWCMVWENPKQWRRWLPLAKFWYNSTFHTALGWSPFCALYGHDPKLGALPAIDEGFRSIENKFFPMKTNNNKPISDLRDAKQRAGEIRSTYPCRSHSENVQMNMVSIVVLASPPRDPIWSKHHNGRRLRAMYTYNATMSPPPRSSKVWWSSRWDQ